MRFAADGTVTVQYFGTPRTNIRVEGTSDFTTWTAGPTATADSLGVASFNVGKISEFAARLFQVQATGAFASRE